VLPDSFKDQFQPFKHFGCDFKDQYKGTLFRFPLRTAALARRSEISKRSYTVSEIGENLKSFSTLLADHLIFLRSVKTIEIYSCLPGQIPYLRHRACSSVSGKEGQNDQSLLQYFDKKNNSPRDVFYEKLLSMPERKLPTLSYTMQVTVDSYTVPLSTVKGSMKTVGNGQGEGVEGINSEETIAEELKNATDQVGDHHTVVVIKKKRDDELEDSAIPSSALSPICTKEAVSFLVVCGLMGGEARRVACEESSRHLKLIPYGAVAACISRVGQNRQIPESGPSSIEGGAGGSCFPPIVGKAFCFLPLPVRTMLPVHTNAYWELSANRRDIWR
jgi:sacsin